jgi:hypothetical protein
MTACTPGSASTVRAASAISRWTWVLSAFILGRASRIVAIWSATSTFTYSAMIRPYNATSEKILRKSLAEEGNH